MLIFDIFVMDLVTIILFIMVIFDVFSVADVNQALVDDGLVDKEIGTGIGAGAAGES